MSIVIKDLTVQFKNGVTAVDHVNLEIEKGIYGLLGENGAGKTTLMRVLTTILKPSGGTVMLNGTLYTEENYEKIQKKIGYLPQELNLYPNLSVRECLEYMGGLSGVHGKECRQRIDCYLEMTNLAEQQNKKIRQLSGGMKRRVGLIQALLNHPEFLIIDEPTTGLDPEERIRIRNLLVDLGKERTILFSTHVVEDLSATCNQLAVMKSGRFLYTGSMTEVLNMTKGHVWECRIREEQVKNLEQKYHVTSKQAVEDGVKLKLISESKPDIACSPVEVTLEDAYMYLMENIPQSIRGSRFQVTF